MATKNAQNELPAMNGPGVASKSIPEIDQAADDYKEIRDARMQFTPRETAAKKKLIDLIHAHEKEIGKAPDGSITYIHGKVKVELFPTKEKLKVSDIEEDEEEQE